MTPFWVTRQFHCPEVFFFPPLQPRMKVAFKGRLCWWPQIRLGTGEGGFSEHTWAILQFGCVSWRGDNKERGWGKATLPLERKTVVLSSSFFSLLRGLLLRVEPQNTLLFDFYPSFWSWHTNLLCGCISVSLSLHIKNLAVKPAINWFSSWYP